MWQEEESGEIRSPSSQPLGPHHPSKDVGFHSGIMGSHWSIHTTARSNFGFNGSTPAAAGTGCRAPGRGQGGRACLAIQNRNGGSQALGRGAVEWVIKT